MSGPNCFMACSPWRLHWARVQPFWLDDLPFPGWGFSKRLLCLGDRVSERERKGEWERENIWRRYVQSILTQKISLPHCAFSTAKLVREVRTGSILWIIKRRGPFSNRGTNSLISPQFSTQWSLFTAAWLGWFLAGKIYWMEAHARWSGKLRIKALWNFRRRLIGLICFDDWFHHIFLRFIRSFFKIREIQWMHCLI
jgi:hypothetical protein